MAEIIVLIGIPGSGKSTFYDSHLGNSHERVSLDIVRTRKCEDKLLNKLFQRRAKIVIDNTNPSVLIRRKYIELAKRNRYKIYGYQFESKPDDCKLRNSRRNGRKRVPDVAIDVIHSNLQDPTIDEGFDNIYFVRISNEIFIVEEIKDDSKKLF